MKAIGVGRGKCRCRAEGRRAGGQEGRRQGQEPILDPMGRAAWV